jgi:hypothetical protein
LNGLIDPRVHSLLKKPGGKDILIQVIPIQGKGFSEIQLSNLTGIEPDAIKSESSIHSRPEAERFGDRYHLALHVLSIVKQIPYIK